MLNLPKLILASGSPRRSEILNSVGWEFEKVVADIDETEFIGENPADYVQRLAKEKAEFVAVNYSNQIVRGISLSFCKRVNIILLLKVSVH